MSTLHEAGSRNTHKAACDLIGLSQTVAGFVLTSLIPRENFGTCADWNFRLKVAIHLLSLLQSSHEPSPLLQLEFVPPL